MGRGKGGRGDRPLPYPQAAREIRKIWNEGTVTWTKHAEGNLKNRRLDMLDIENIIRYGRVTDHSRPGDAWRYKIEGKSVDERPASCVVAIDGEHLVIVTVIA